MHRSTFLLLIGALSLPASALTDKEVAGCAAIDGDLSRLQCYDNLAKKHKLAGPQPSEDTPKGKGGWYVHSTTNPLDDSKTVVLRIASTSGSNQYGRPVTLLLRCHSNQTDAFLNWDSYLGSDADVTTRIGSSTAKTAAWDISTDKKASFHPQPIPFIKEMMKADKVAFQVTPYSSSPITAIFDTTGLEESIKPLRETCGW